MLARLPLGFCVHMVHQLPQLFPLAAASITQNKVETATLLGNAVNNEYMAWRCATFVFGSYVTARSCAKNAKKLH